MAYDVSRNYYFQCSPLNASSWCFSCRLGNVWNEIVFIQLSSYGILETIRISLIQPSNNFVHHPHNYISQYALFGLAKIFEWLSISFWFLQIYDLSIWHSKCLEKIFDQLVELSSSLLRIYNLISSNRDIFCSITHILDLNIHKELCKSESMEDDNERKLVVKQILK